MKQSKYTGTFANGSLGEVFCTGFIQAFILLTAKAIQEGSYYQLEYIVNEFGTRKEAISLEDLFSH